MGTLGHELWPVRGFLAVKHAAADGDDLVGPRRRRGDEHFLHAGMQLWIEQALRQVDGQVVIDPNVVESGAAPDQREQAEQRQAQLVPFVRPLDLRPQRRIDAGGRLFRTELGLKGTEIIDV